MNFVVAIDGPSGTGKGTITKLVSEKLGLVNIDTGATYRCIAVAVTRNNLKTEEEQKIVELIDTLSIELKQEDTIKVFLNDEDVTTQIRTPEITKLTALISKIPEVRYKLVELQRKMAKGKNVIMEGRDIGTCVFPNADVKIYLDASSTERAQRRYLQNKEKGMEVSFDDVLKSIEERDKIDSQRKVGALKKADDAIYIDSTKLTIDEVEEKVINIIKEKLKEGL